ncbi:NHLP family bacteriocin export ABC transporter peptidase/permease/ATPase subunit [Desulfovibrio sp. JC010]|uniref:NHLP family bacteriocin export ABC transporter peptidase/permease/ATPase subunit n=1 Tax=Desulfovibrio sp. JC010 TaxID=2593641 RepID=UPI0013D0BFFF|nr:NHLP family bacteriocin export ABC transporter peptidase/permease/ATPase subunit [Desulfovibrio sp. JC010]NDV27670.1 NHLP family bacteriocin export ABC transporter peptidase/permease/ATPase subunit [Desulfovibrio sp. JC010]
MALIEGPWEKARVKTPTVIQMEAVECGAAALGIILGAYGRIVPLEELRTACGVSRDGSKASNVLKAARTYGLEARGFKKGVDGLTDMSLPMILFWNFNHFLVLEGIKGDTVFLNDPASGPRTVTREELDQSFTGVVLTFNPTDSFKKGGSSPSVIQGLSKLLEGSRKAALYILLAALFMVVPGLLMPIFLKVFVDKILMGISKDWLPPLLLGMFLAAMLQTGLTWLQQMSMLKLETKLALSGSAKLFRHILRLPMDFFHQRMPGDIQSRFSLYTKLSGLLGGQLGSTVLGMMTASFFLLVMLFYSVPLTLLGMVIAAFNLILLKIVSRKRKDLSLRLSQDSGKLMGISMSGLQQIETLKASGQENDFFNQWAGYQAKTVNSSQKLALTSQLISVIPSVLGYINSAAILGVGALLVMDGQMTVGMLVAFQALMHGFMGPVQSMVGLGGQLQSVGADLTRLKDVFSNPCDPFLSKQLANEEKPEGPGVSDVRGRLEFKDITFGYSKLGPPLITNFSLDVPAGSRIALVGGSGSGKSTLAKLVTGLESPWSGQILLDGIPIEEYGRDVFTDSVALVDQDISMFEGTVRDNLTMWDASVPEEQMVRAAKDGCIHEVITARPGGYAAKLSEGGSNLSGGQKQRLEIARALVGNPKLLIMDEATSALDAETEKLVDQNIRKRGCTCLIIAHRLSTIRDADLIVALQGGREMERGTYAELMDRDGFFARLVNRS